MIVRVRTLRQIMETKREGRPWVWEGYLARGNVTALSGAPKVGKTTLLAGLVAALADGRPTYCGAALTPCPVIYVSEESELEWEERGTQWPEQVWDAIDLVTREDLAVPYRWPELVLDVRDYALEVGAGLVVFDTFRKLARLGENSENDSGAITESLHPLHDAAGHNLAVLTNHHDRKGGGENGEGAAGSGAFFGGVDALVTMRRFGGADDPRRRLEVLGRWRAPDELVVELRGGDYVALGSRAEVKAEDSKRQAAAVAEDVLELLRGHGEPADVKEVAAMLGEEVTEKVTRAALTLLMDTHRVDRVGKGRKGDPFRFVARVGIGTERIETEEPPDDDLERWKELAA